MANTDLCRDSGGTIIPPDRDCTCEGIYKAINDVLPNTPSESGQYALTANVDGDQTTIGWQSGGGGGSCDPGYECTETSTVLTEENVTTTSLPDVTFTSGTLSYSERLTQEKLTITFDGVEYVCAKNDIPNGALYGDFDFDFVEYPFAIVNERLEITLYTGDAGTHSIKIEEVTESVTTTPCFEKAVDKASQLCTPTFTLYYSPDGETASVDTLFSDLESAYLSKRLLYAYFGYDSTPENGKAIVPFSTVETIQTGAISSIIFEKVSMTADAIYAKRFIVNSNDTVTVEKYTFSTN